MRPRPTPSYKSEREGVRVTFVETKKRKSSLDKRGLSLPWSKDTGLKERTEKKSGQIPAS